MPSHTPLLHPTTAGFAAGANGTRPHASAPRLPHDLAHWPSAVASRRTLLRQMLGLAGAGSLPLTLLGCGGGGDEDSAAGGDASDTTGNSSSDSDSASCTAIPTETAGPYPADGSLASSQRLNALALAGIVRPDIRTSVGDASGTAQGVPLTVTLTLVNSAASCTPLVGCAVYLWHCTRDGSYSLYSSGHTDENYLRGVQVSDANGQVSFTTVFPGCYSGRWPHIHFEVYASLDDALDATAVSDHLTVSQLALPAAACAAVYADASGYSASATHFGQISLASDNVFRDDSAARQLASVSGSPSAGYAATLTVGVAG